MIRKRFLRRLHCKSEEFKVRYLGDEPVALLLLLRSPTASNFSDKFRSAWAVCINIVTERMTYLLEVIDVVFGHEGSVAINLHTGKPAP
jgi:hypothetical protein